MFRSPREIEQHILDNYRFTEVSGTDQIFDPKLQ